MFPHKVPRVLSGLTDIVKRIIWAIRRLLRRSGDQLANLQKTNFSLTEKAVGLLVGRVGGRRENAAAGNCLPTDIDQWK